MGLVPLMVSMFVLMGATFTAVYAKKLFVHEVNRKHKMEIFENIDWTQPDKIKDEDITEKSPKKQMLIQYCQKAIMPSILMIGAAASQPFYVISLHVANARHNQGQQVVQLKESATRNSYRAYFHIKRKYGFRGFFRGLLPTTLYSVIVLYDILIQQIFTDD